MHNTCSFVVASVEQQRAARYLQTSVALVVAVVVAQLRSDQVAYACTIGVATGAATFDGRPILTQSYDYPFSSFGYLAVLDKPTSGLPSVRVCRREPSGYLGWQTALNDEGLAYGLNIAPALGNWVEFSLYSKVAPEMATLADVRSRLDQLAEYQPNHNFVFVDGAGNASAMEIGHNQYWEYDVRNATRHSDSDFFYGGINLFAVRADISFLNDNHTETQARIDEYAGEFGTPTRFLNARQRFSDLINDGDRLTLADTYQIARFGDPWTGLGPGGPISAPRSPDSGWATQYGVTVLGVNSGEDGRYATMLVALGQPDYSVFVPCWAHLEQLSPYLEGDGTDYESIRKYAVNFLRNRVEQDSDAVSFDEYVQSILGPVEDNLAQGVLEARARWFAGETDTSRFALEIDHLHRWGADAAYHTIKSAYLTADQGSGVRNCNTPPVVDFSTTVDGSTVTLSDAGSDDTDGISQHWINWGDDATDHVFAGDLSQHSHDYAATGNYMVSVLVEDDNATQRARNVRFQWITVGGCEPECEGKQCGDDGCGGSCGSCSGDEVCDGGQCLFDLYDAGDGQAQDADADLDEDRDTAGGRTSGGCECRTVRVGALHGGGLGTEILVGLF